MICADRHEQRTILFDDMPYVAHASAAAYDVHPDGRRFVMVRRGAEGPQVVVVLNLFDQLGAALARRSKSPDQAYLEDGANLEELRALAPVGA